MHIPFCLLAMATSIKRAKFLSSTPARYTDVSFSGHTKKLLPRIVAIKTDKFKVFDISLLHRSHGNNITVYHFFRISKYIIRNVNITRFYFLAVI